MDSAIKPIIQTLTADLGSQLEAVFLFGSQAAQQYQTAVSDTNLLLIISPYANMHAVRDSFQPLWQQHKASLKRAPLVATRLALQRHLRLNSHLALHLMQYGQQLHGEPLSPDFFRTRVNPYETYAHLAHELLDASAALGQNSDLQAEMRLNRLARQVHSQPMAQDETTVHQFNLVQQGLTGVLKQLPAAKVWYKAAQTGPTSPNIPGLQAIYAENNKNIFVFNQLTPKQINQIKWPVLAKQLSQTSTLQRNASLHITTVAQFCLIGLYDKALDLRFNKYQHKWGIPFLSTLTPSRHQILRQAARLPSQILVDDLPQSYLTAANTQAETLHKLIHDFQNRMLNIQLENELLFRLGLITEKFTPPEPLPERDTPPKQRLNAIFQHLEWWADFYQTALKAAT